MKGSLNRGSLKVPMSSVPCMVCFITYLLVCSTLSSAYFMDYLFELIYIPQRGVQWKQGVVIYMMLYTSLLYILPPSTAPPSHCTPTVMNTQLM